MGFDMIQYVSAPARLAALILGIVAAILAQTRDTSVLGAESASLPNVVVILTDDQGWGDLGVNGNRNLSTPRIDSLAREGASVEHFYVCQVCAPTRAEFLTGRYYPRTGVSGVSRGEERLNPDETTIAELFKSAGYATGAFGKWHNGTQPPYHPNDRGFDEYYGFTSGHWGHYFSPPLDHNGQVVRGNGFVVDDFTDRAIEFIRSHRERPFFCYLPINTPHSPMMVPDRFYEKFDGFDPPMRHRDPEKEDVMMTRAALAMVENIDWNVGRLLDVLDETGLREETIVVFFCDNGPNSFRWNGGMKGRKGSIDEGGLRSPLFVRWPGTIPAGTRVKPIAGAIDLLPTLCDLAGIPSHIAKPIDGRSLRPLLLDDDHAWEPRHLFSTKANQVSVRTERFRLDAQGQLFDIEPDPGQREDVSSEFPELTRELLQLARTHRDEMSKDFARYADRPFAVGYREATTLPARDGVPHGTIQRSAKAPNNSFFENWTDVDDSITWDIEVHQADEYQVTVFYTCAKGDQGAVITASVDGHDGVARGTVTKVFDPPLYDKSKERVANSHYFVKDFEPLSLDRLKLERGRGTLRLKAESMPGNQAIDVHSIRLVR
jgi:arylsulfatase A-like enzyme